jgi:hypothetical protein
MSLKPVVYAVTPTITPSVAYSSGQCVGGLQKVSSPSAGGNIAVLDSLTIVDVANQKAPLTVMFFDADPTAATPTAATPTAATPTPATVADGSAFAFGSSSPRFIGKVDVAAGSYETIGGEAIAALTNLRLVLQVTTPPGALATLYAVVVTTGTPTYQHASDLTLRYGFTAGTGR